MLLADFNMTNGKVGTAKYWKDQLLAHTRHTQRQDTAQDTSPFITMSGAYGIWTSPVRAETTKVSFEDTRKMSVGPDGIAALSISVKTSLHTGRHFKSKSKSKPSKRRRQRPLDVPRELLTLSQRGVDTHGSALDLDPRTDDGSPVVPRAFTQSLNTRPYTKDQRLAQLRGLIVQQNPRTLHQPESFHVHSFFESAAPGFRVNSASTNQLRPPHSRPKTTTSVLSEKNGEKVEEEKDFLLATENYTNDDTIDTDSRKQKHRRRTPTLSTIYQQHTEDKKRGKSLGADWPIGPKVDDGRLHAHYNARRLRKTAVPLAPLDPPLPSVDEMPPIPNDSFFLAHLSNSLRATRGFETTLGGGNARQQPRRRRRRRRKRKKQAHNNNSEMTASSSSSGGIVMDVTLAAPLMATRRLFGREEIGEGDDYLPEEQEPSVVSPPSQFNESVDRLHFGDEDLTPKKQRPSTAPSAVRAGNSIGRADMPGSMRMTVVVREKDRSKGKKGKKRRTTVHRENARKRAQSESQRDDGNNNDENQRRDDGDEAMEMEMEMSKLNMESKSDNQGIMPERSRAWIDVPVVVVCTQDIAETGGERDLIETKVLPFINIALASRYVRLTLLDVRTDKDNEIDILNDIDMCRHYVVVLRGSKYTTNFDALARYALQTSVEMQAQKSTTGGGAVCFLKTNKIKKSKKLKAKDKSKLAQDKANIFDVFCRGVSGLCVVKDYTETSDIVSLLTDAWLPRLENEYEIMNPTTSWIRKERMKHSSFKRRQVQHGRGVPGLLEGVAESVKMNVGMSPVVVLGSQGIGKSHSMAVLSDFIQDSDEGFCAITHYVDSSTNARKLCPVLARLSTELRLLTVLHQVGGGTDTEAILEAAEADFLKELSCQNYPRLCTAFRTEFHRCSATLAKFGKTLVLLIDGVDQLEVDRLEWLPVLIPSNAQLVLSSAPSSSALRSLWYRYGQLQTFDLDSNPTPQTLLEDVLKSVSAKWEDHSSTGSVINASNNNSNSNSNNNESGRPGSPAHTNIGASVLQKHRGANIEYVRCVAWRLHRESKRRRTVLNDQVAGVGAGSSQSRKAPLPRTTQGLLEEEFHQADVDLREFFVRHVRARTGDVPLPLPLPLPPLTATATAVPTLEEWIAASVELFASLASALWVTRTTLSFNSLILLVDHLLNTTWKLRERIPLDHPLRPNPTLVAARVLGSLGPHVGAGRADKRLTSLGLSTTSACDCVGNMFLKTPVHRARAQGILAAYCLNVGDPNADGTWKQQETTTSTTPTPTSEMPQREEKDAWCDAVLHVVEYQLSGHEVLGLRATLCNPWYLRARCITGANSPTGIDGLLTDYQRALECLADPVYVALHCTVYGTSMHDVDIELHSMSDALTELYQFILHRQIELSTMPESLTLQCALLEWMTRLPCELVQREEHAAQLFCWRNKPKRPARLTAHVGYDSVITSCAVSRPVRFVFVVFCCFGICCLLYLWKFTEVVCFILTVYCFVLRNLQFSYVLLFFFLLVSCWY